MIYAGLKIIMPSLFLVTSLAVCSLTSLATGTSWGTIGTVGVALMGIGAGLGFEPGLTAATIICGAFFGDKMSPLSDTTNMAGRGLRQCPCSGISDTCFSPLPRPMS